jgi:hypothetical protein
LSPANHNVPEAYRSRVERPSHIEKLESTCESQRSGLRYDHLSCFVMKPRYNCAKPGIKVPRPRIEVVLQSSVNTSRK